MDYPTDSHYSVVAQGKHLRAFRALLGLGTGAALDHAKRPACSVKLHPHCASVNGNTLGRGFWNRANGCICDRCIKVMRRVRDGKL